MDLCLGLKWTEEILAAGILVSVTPGVLGDIEWTSKHGVVTYRSSVGHLPCFPSPTLHSGPSWVLQLFNSYCTDQGITPPMYAFGIITCIQTSKTKSSTIFLCLAFSAPSSLFGQKLMLLFHGSLTSVNRASQCRSWLYLSTQTVICCSSPSLLWYSSKTTYVTHLASPACQHMLSTLEGHGNCFEIELQFSNEDPDTCPRQLANGRAGRCI